MYLYHARKLIHEGCTHVPFSTHGVSQADIDAASESNQILIAHLRSLRCQTQFARDGNEDDEMFLVHLDGSEGKDIKYFLHTAHDVLGFIDQVPELVEAMNGYWVHLENVLRLYNQLNQFIFRILICVEQEIPTLGQYGHQISKSFARSCYQSIPYGTTVLRGLFYSAEENHQGASPHPDRSFITAVCKDYGGRLIGHRERGCGHAFDISPANGDIFLMWGAKAPVISDDVLMPLWHSAVTSPGEDRSSMVLFGHVEVITQGQTQMVRASKKFLTEYCKEKGVDEDEWYESFWQK